MTDLERARSAALERECAVLADTLKQLTHEYVSMASRPGYCRTCLHRADDTRHRTPAFLRKRYGLGP